jgi:hypothetical protein
MMKAIGMLLVTLMLSTQAFASGYGGYDQEPVEVTPVEVTLTGVAKSTCEESKNTIKVSFGSTCESTYELNNSCPCIDVDSKNYCQYTTTIVCYPHYELYY